MDGCSRAAQRYDVLMTGVPALRQTCGRPTPNVLIPPRGGSPKMSVWILRGAYIALTLGVALYAVQNFQPDTPTSTLVLTFVGIILGGGGVLAADILIRNKQITTVSAVYFGLLLGLLLG